MEVEHEDGDGGYQERERGGGVTKKTGKKDRTSNGRVKCFILKQCQEGQMLGSFFFFLRSSIGGVVYVTVFNSSAT